MKKREDFFYIRPTRKIFSKIKNVYFGCCRWSVGLFGHFRAEKEMESSSSSIAFSFFNLWSTKWANASCVHSATRTTTTKMHSRKKIHIIKYNLFYSNMFHFLKVQIESLVININENQVAK